MILASRKKQYIRTLLIYSPASPQSQTLHCSYFRTEQPQSTPLAPLHPPSRNQDPIGMDQNGFSKTEIPSNKPNKHHRLLMKRTLQVLVPVSLASFLLSSSFSFLFTYTLQYYLTFIYPLLAHTFERKYMFLIFNGILAFLVKTLRFNDDTSFLSVSEIDDNDESSTKVADEFRGKPVSAESSPDQNVALADDEEEEEKQGTNQIKGAVAGEEEPQEEAALAVVELGGKPKVSSAVEKEVRQTGDFIIESEELDMMSEVDDEEEDMEEGGKALAEQEMDVNENTEELNKKFEEFIRKVKEEFRIQARQQLIAV